MADLSKLSDEEFDKIVQAHVPKVAAPAGPPSQADLSQLSDDELDAIAGHAIDKTVPDEKTTGQKALDVINGIGKAVDSVTAAPTRSAIGALQDGGGLGGAASAFKEQFAEDPGLAPSGKDIVKKAGVPDQVYSFHEKAPAANDPDYYRFHNDPLFREQYLKSGKGSELEVNPADDLGVATELTADFTNLVPVGAAARVIGRGSKAAVKGAGMLTKGAVGLASPGARAAIEASEETLKNVAKALGSVVKPAVRADYTKSVQVALKNGIDPEVLSSSIKYGPDAFITKAKKVRAQGPLGEQMLLEHRQGLNQIREALDRKVSTISGGKPALDPLEAGEEIKAAYDRAVDKIFSERDVTYAKLAEAHPDLAVPGEVAHDVSKQLGDIEAKAQKIIKVAATPGRKAQAEQVIAVVQNLRQNLRRPKFANLVEELQDVGDVAYKSFRPVNASDLPPNVELFREIYDTLRDGTFATTRTAIGADKAESLEQSNRVLTEFFRKNEKIAATLNDGNKGGEAIFRELVESGNSERLRALTEILGDDPEALGGLKASFFETLKTADKDGGVSFARLRNTLQNNDKARRIMKEIFSPKELSEIEELIHLGDEYGAPILNTSGTDVSRAFRDIPAEIGRQSVGDGLIKLLESRATSAPAAAAPGPSRAAGGILEGITPMPGKAETLLRGARVSSMGGQEMRAAEDEPIVVPPELVPAMRQRIRGNQALSNTEKAKALSRLNEKGEIVDPRLLEEPKRNPTGLPLDDVRGSALDSVLKKR